MNSKYAASFKLNSGQQAGVGLRIAGAAQGARLSLLPLSLLLLLPIGCRA